MRFGVTKFQHYYLEVHSYLDYLELYKLHIDVQKPAETVVNCIGTFTNIQVTYLVPLTFKIMGQSCSMQHIGIFRGLATSSDRHAAIHSYS